MVHVECANPAFQIARFANASSSANPVRGVLREDQAIHAQLMLLGLFDLDCERLASMPEEEFTAATGELRRRLDTARAVLKAA